MKKSNLFRKTSLERVSSPDQLDEYIKVVSPNLILLIVAIFAILFSGLVWIFSSDIPKYQQIPGVIVSENGSRKLYSYVDIGTSRKLSVGMKTRVTPDYLASEDYGYIEGEIISVGSKILDSDDILSKFYNPNIVADIIPSYACIEIVSILGASNKEKMDTVDIIDGTKCIAKVVVGQERAIDFIFNTKK